MSYIITEPRFTLEKRIPLALIFAISLQIGMGLVWAAQLDTRVARIEKDIDRLGTKLDVISEKLMH